MKKNTGKRTRPLVRTEREQIVKRLRQAGRAYDAGRSREANEVRIKRLEARLVEIDTPPVPASEPETVAGPTETPEIDAAIAETVEMAQLLDAVNAA